METRRDETTFTVNEWILQWLVERVRQYVSEWQAAERTGTIAVFKTLTLTDQQAIIQKLGGHPFAGL